MQNRRDRRIEEARKRMMTAAIAIVVMIAAIAIVVMIAAIVIVVIIATKKARSTPKVQ